MSEILFGLSQHCPVIVWENWGWFSVILFCGLHLFLCHPLLWTTTVALDKLLKFCICNWMPCVIPVFLIPAMIENYVLVSILLVTWSFFNATKPDQKHTIKFLWPHIKRIIRRIWHIFIFFGETVTIVVIGTSRIIHLHGMKIKVICRLVNYWANDIL